MTPTTFTWRFKCILKKNGLPQELNVHSLRHTAASPVGMAVTVTACLTAAEGRTLTFRLTAEDTAGPIGEGDHTRAIVRVGRFMEKTNAKLTP